MNLAGQGRPADDRRLRGGGSRTGGGGRPAQFAGLGISQKAC